MRARTALFLGAVSMLVAVALGAFGAHALKARLPVDMLGVWQTAVQYQAWHGLALLVVGVWRLHAPSAPGLGPAGWLFAAGIVLFSGSLYAMALTGSRGLGAVTPVGGVAFLAGWAILAWRAVMIRDVTPR